MVQLRKKYIIRTSKMTFIRTSILVIEGRMSRWIIIEMILICLKNHIMIGIVKDRWKLSVSKKKSLMKLLWNVVMRVTDHEGERILAYSPPSYLLKYLKGSDNKIGSLGVSFCCCRSVFFWVKRTKDFLISPTDPHCVKRPIFVNKIRFWPYLIF